MQSKDEMSNLGYLLRDIVPEVTVVNVSVNGLCIDSNEVRTGDLFIALNGTNTNGRKFIQNAVNNGAIAVLLDGKKDNLLDNFTIPIFGVDNLRSKLGLLASRFYSNPSQDLRITGITGTNGKTSIAYFLAQVITGNGDLKVGSIGTLGCGIFENLEPYANTTPDVVSINKLLNDFRSNNINDVVMEVSSHGLDQGRINNIFFDTAVFTNLSHDHLDYHGDMSSYGETKRKLFEARNLKNVVINVNDKFGEQLALNINKEVNKVSYGISNSRHLLRTSPDISAYIKQQEINALTLEISSPWGSGELTVSLSGHFNAYNVLACLGVLCVQGMSFSEALNGLSKVRGVPGRMEYFGTVSSTKIFVDYSHTPDSFMQVLETLRRGCGGELTCVFGCGGDRDKGKRHKMGSIAEQYADRVFLTNDNPRSEPPERIIEDIKSGMKGTSTIEIQTDRSVAIREAIQTANSDGCVLIAGKGHETYQEIGSVKYPFSDRQQVRNILGCSDD